MEAEKKVVEAAQRGSRRAFEVLVHRYQPWVIRTAYRLLGNETEADDVAQDVWLRIYRSLPSFRAESRFSTWLYRIATNETLSALKRLRRHQRHRSDQPLEEVAHADGKPNARRILEGREMEEQFRQAFDALPPERRMVITLVLFENMTHRDAGVILNMPEKTVSWHLFKAREFLAQKMKD